MPLEVFSKSNTRPHSAHISVCRSYPGRKE